MATRSWTGGAVTLKDTKTVTIANTWANDTDSATITINGKDLVVSIGTDDSSAQVATAIKEAFNGDAQTGTGDHTSSPAFTDGGGQAIPEFTEMVATVSGSVVTLTATDNAAGKPITVTETVTTAGSGTAVIATTINGTGPNDMNNADNWSGDTLPVDGDTVIFDSGDVDALWNLQALAIQPVAFTRTASYTGKIGLSEMNTDNSGQAYDEYRTTYWTWANDGGTSATTVTLEGGGGRTKIDFADAGNITVNGTGKGTRNEFDVPEILLKGTDSDTIINVQRGDVGAAFYAGEAFTLASLKMGWISSRALDAQVFLGTGCTTSSMAVTKAGGELEINTAFASITQTAGETTVNGTGAISGVQKIYGGVYRINTTGTVSGVITAGGSGEVTFDGDPRTKTVSNPIEKHGDRSIIRDHQKAVTSLVVDCNESEASDNIELGTDARLTRAATA